MHAGDAPPDLTNHFQATQAREHEVDDQHVRLQLFGERQRLQHIGRLADHRPVALALAAMIAALGPTLLLLPIDALRVIMGTLLLIFGLQWLRKAILRAGHYTAFQDEAALYRRELADARAAGRPSRTGMDCMPSHWRLKWSSWKGWKWPLSCSRSATPKGAFRRLHGRPEQRQATTSAPVAGMGE